MINVMCRDVLLALLLTLPPEETAFVAKAFPLCVLSFPTALLYLTVYCRSLPAQLLLSRQPVSLFQPVSVAAKGRADPV